MKMSEKYSFIFGYILRLKLQLLGIFFYDGRTREIHEASNLLTNPETDNKQDDEQNDADSNPPCTRELPKHFASGKQGGSQDSSNDGYALVSKQGKKRKSREYIKSVPANNFVDLYKNTVTALVLFYLLSPVVGDQKHTEKILCKPQQPVSSFRLLTDDAICQQPDQLACKDGSTFICAFHVNGSLGSGCVEKFCFHGQYCPQFTQLQNGEKEETVIQDGGRCTSCNSFYNITAWRKYEECYSLTTTTGPLDTSSKNVTDIDTKLADNQETSLKWWEIVIIIASVILLIVIVAALLWKYMELHGTFTWILQKINESQTPCTVGVRDLEVPLVQRNEIHKKH